MILLDIFPLPLFPQGSLSSSIITTVWVGIFVIAYFNLRLGWVLSGLVVPGYVVPLLILNPWSAAVIILEAMVAYLIVWLLSEYLSRWAPWCNFFGRDRFLAIVLTSVLVRVVFDGWLLHYVGEYVVRHYHLQFDYRNQLHSFGLIIVALIANQFWKTGLIRGLIPLFASLGITYLIVRFGLMELTNFSISYLSYMYEDLAISILSAPKAYIIVVTTAFIASRMNLRYNWDFNGILIPALLALQWYQPHKILFSFVEAFIILFLAHFVLTIPYFRSMTIEGARKLLLFFNIGFIYKMGLGYFLLWFMPEVKMTDYYAFGYLLSTLVAIRMHDKQIVIRMTTAVLKTSFIGVVLASLLGFSLTMLPTLWEISLPTNTVANIQIKQEQTELTELIRQDEIVLYQGHVPDSYIEPSPQEIGYFKKGLKDLLAYQQQRRGEPACSPCEKTFRSEPACSPCEKTLLQQAAAYFAQVNYETLLVQQRYIYLREITPKRGWGVYVLDLKANNRLLVEIPAALDEWGMVEAGSILFKQMQGYALAIAGSAKRANKNGASDMLINYQSLFQIFHRQLAQRNVLQVRAYTPKTRRVLNNTYPEMASNLTQLPSSLWIKKELPSGLNLSLLEQLIGHYIIQWTNTPFRNVQRDLTYTGFTELFLNQTEVFNLLFSQIKKTQIPLNVSIQSIDGYLQEWLLTGKAHIAPKGTNLYQPPSSAELLFFDKAILTPLLKLIRTEYQDGHWSDTGLEQLRILIEVATTVGYNIVRYRQRQTQTDYLILEEQSDIRRYWGTYVFRLGMGQNYMIQVPRPLYDVNSFEYAVALFARLQASVLLIAGTHPTTNIDRSSDLIKYGNLKSIFNAVSQVTLREWGNKPMLVIQSRAYAKNDDGSLADTDVLLAFDKGIASQASLSELGQHLFDSLRADGLNIKFVHGEAATAGYEVGNLPQALYLPATQKKEFAQLWLSASARQYYRQQTENNIQGTQFRALNVPTVKDNDTQTLYDYITSRPAGQARHISKAFRARVKEYIQKQDILILQDLIKSWPQYHLERFIDINSKQAFLLVYTDEGKLSLIANLFPRKPDSQVQLSLATAKNQETVTRFIETRTAWLAFQ